MSAHDSVSTVYKCMLRGASDFLVKPVRKNELKNLWQHVWRRQSVRSLMVYDELLIIEFKLVCCDLISVCFEFYFSLLLGVTRTMKRVMRNKK